MPLAAAGTAAIAGLGVAVKGTIDAADEMSKAAAKFGVPIEELSRLKYAADLSDVSLEGLGTSLGRLSKNMVAAAEGSGPMAEAFAAAGIAVKNADGSLRSSTAVLADLSDKFAAMPDGAEKTALAMQLMGRSGAEMIPLLNEGSAALAKMKAEADTFGQVFTAEMGANAEAFNDNITRLQGSFANIAADLTAKLLPTLTQFSNWLVENGPTIAARTAEFIEFGAKVAGAFQAIVPALNAFSDAMHGGTTAIGALVTAANNLAAQIGQGVTSAVQAVRDALVQMEQAVAEFRDRFIQLGRDLIAGLVQGIREKISGAVDAVRSGVGNIISAAKSALGVQSPSTVFAEIGRNIMQGLSGGITSSMGQVEGEVGSFAQGLASAFAGILNGASDWRDALSNILSSVGGNLIQSGLGGLAKSFGLPGFASGGITSGGPILVGERGPEVVTPPRGSRIVPNHHLGGQTTIMVDVRGATGNQEVQRMVAAGVSAGMNQVRREVPGIVTKHQVRFT